ncbi:MAG TPA: DUF1570 domain-containing protein [Planctomycetota bacterium]|nr:DUF1570 domain-containing protein [Planctomycetota bacterium]
MRCQLFTILILLASCGAVPALHSADKPERNSPWPAPPEEKIDALKSELKKNLDGSFAISSIGPWVIATDMDAAEAERITRGTIAVCAAGIQRQLFTKEARSEPAKVYLFKDGDSYTAWNKKLFGEKPMSIFGYFSRATNSLVMNIGTGGGTLVHEMVHAMAEADYPDIPAWLNEGLGSLYEACNTLPDGKVIGVVNWRLKGIQDDLKNNTATQLDALIGMSDGDFYDDARKSSNYAAARYFMQWMQEQGKLEAFYTRVRDKKDSDPKASLLKVFDDKMTVTEIQKKCFEWVGTLRLRR